MEMVKSKPKSDSGNQKEEKHAESKQFKQGIVIGSISALISSVVLAVLTVLFSNVELAKVLMKTHTQDSYAHVLEQFNAKEAKKELLEIRSNS